MMKPEQKIKLAVKPSQELINSTKFLIRNGKTKKRVPYRSIIAVACCGVLTIGLAAHSQIFSLLGMENKCKDKDTKCGGPESYAVSDNGKLEEEALVDKLEEVKYEDLVFANGDTGDTSQLEYFESRLAAMADGICSFDEDMLFSEPTALLKVTVTSLERDEECDRYGLSVDEFLCGNLIVDYDTTTVSDYRDYIPIPIEKLSDTGSLMQVEHKYVLPVTASGAILSVQPPIEITQDGMYMITTDWKSFGGRGEKLVNIGSLADKLDYDIYLLNQRSFNLGLEDLKLRYATSSTIPPAANSVDYLEDVDGTIRYENITFANNEKGTSDIMDAIAAATATMDLKGFSEDDIFSQCIDIVEITVKGIHENSYSVSNGYPYGTSPKSIVYECSRTTDNDGSRQSESFIIEDFFYGTEPIALMKDGHIYVVPIYSNDEETKEYDGLSEQKESSIGLLHHYMPPIEVTYHGNYVVPGAWKSLVKNSSFDIDASFGGGLDYSWDIGACSDESLDYNMYDFKYVPREEFKANLEKLIRKYFQDSEDSRTLEGRGVFANGNFLLASYDGELYQMSAESIEIFGKLETGDEISVTYDGSLAETYPIQINVTDCQILNKGSVEDLSEDTIKALKELGWNIDSWETIHGKRAE